MLCGGCEKQHAVPCIRCGAKNLELLEKVGPIFYVRCNTCQYEGSFSDNPDSKPEDYPRTNNRRTG